MQIQIQIQIYKFKCKCNSFPISFDCGTFLWIRHHHNLNLNCILKRFQAGSVTAIKGGIILLLLLLLPSPLSHRSGVAVKIQTRPKQLSSLSRHEKWPQLTLSRQRLPKAQKSTKKTSSALRLPRMSALTFEWRQNRPEQSFYCALLSLNDREVHDWTWVVKSKHWWSWAIIILTLLHYHMRMMTHNRVVRPPMGDPWKPQNPRGWALVIEALQRVSLCLIINPRIAIFEMSDISWLYLLIMFSFKGDI